MNPFEEQVKDKYETEGWTVLRSGWPDFLLFKELPDGTTEVKAVEAKSEFDVLRPNQVEMLKILSRIMNVRIAAEGASFGSDPGENMTILIFKEEPEYRSGVSIPAGVKL